MLGTACNFSQNTEIETKKRIHIAIDQTPCRYENMLWNSTMNNSSVFTKRVRFCVVGKVLGSRCYLEPPVQKMEQRLCLL